MRNVRRPVPFHGWTVNASQPPVSWSASLNTKSENSEPGSV